MTDILIVEDNINNLKLLERRLKLNKLTFQSAMDGNSGLKMLTEFRPKLVLLDINLPDIDGYQFYQCMKIDDNTKDIPVIAVTANAMSEDEQKVLAAGMNGYVSKPVDFKILIAKINTLIDKENSKSP